MPPRLVLALATLSACLAAGLVGLWLASSQRDAAEPAFSSTGFEGALRPPGLSAPELTGLRDQDGKAVRMADYRGGPVVVTFVYSTCRDTCPAQVQTIRGALDDLGRDVPVLAVSVDPAADTRAHVRRFVNEQHMTGRMRYLTGPRSALRRVWRAYGIAPQRGAEDHSAYVVLVDGEGDQRVGWPANYLTSDGLAHDLRRLGVTGSR